MRKAKPAQRLNALYVISTICRHSLKKHKLQDKYSMCQMLLLTFQQHQCRQICVCTSYAMFALQLVDGAPA